MVGVHLCKHTHEMGLTQVDRAFCQGAVNIIGDAHGEAVSLHKIDIVMFQPIGPAKSPLAEDSVQVADHRCGLGKGGSAGHKDPKRVCGPLRQLGMS